jgi:hypothetical protein
MSFFLLAGTLAEQRAAGFSAVYLPERTVLLGVSNGLAVDCNTDPPDGKLSIP